jgi:hypothetical protein
MRSLYLPLIIFWNAATGQPQVSADFAFAMARSPVGFSVAAGYGQSQESP